VLKSLLQHHPSANGGCERTCQADVRAVLKCFLARVGLNAHETGGHLLVDAYEE
jgi:hypothetical protein